MSAATLIEALLCLLTLAVLIPAVVLFIQIVMARAVNAASQINAEPRPSVAILIPAHDEALGIAATLRSLTAQLETGDRLLVVADNCSDDTARVAAEGGAEVLE